MEVPKFRSPDFVVADFLALDSLAVVGNANLPRDLLASGIRMNLLDHLLLQGALLDWPLLALLVKLEAENRFIIIRGPYILSSRAGTGT